MNREMYQKGHSDCQQQHIPACLHDMQAVILQNAMQALYAIKAGYALHFADHTFL